MRTFVFFGILFSSSLLWAETKALMPAGAITEGSTFTARQASSADSFVVANRTEQAAELENVRAEDVVEVISVKPKVSNGDSATMQALANVGSLFIKKSQVTGSPSVSCSVTNGVYNCTALSDVSVSQGSAFNAGTYMNAIFQTDAWKKGSLSTSSAKKTDAKKEDLKKDNEKKEAPAEKKTPQQEQDEAAASAAVETIQAANKKLNPLNTSANCDETNFPEDVRNNKELSCGLKQALEAYKQNKSKITKEVFIFNDFSDGGVMGKMYFLNADGSPAKVLDKNPIWTSRGQGGFGAGTGSLKTPNGAVLTKPYRPPRAGNIKDGIELVGLEKGNQDIYSRGVLLHGWDPLNPTEGCIGIAGNLHTRSEGSRNLGGKDYLDKLKKDLLKDGGVMIYNYTPDKAKQCK